MKQTVKRKLFAGWPSSFVRWASLVVWLFLFFGGLITVGSPNRQFPAVLGWVMAVQAGIAEVLQ